MWRYTQAKDVCVHGEAELLVLATFGELAEKGSTYSSGAPIHR